MQRSPLVLDDDDVVGASVRQVAKEIGCRVTATTSLETFLIAVSEDAAAEIVLDLQLGGRDGVELLQALSGQGCSARIILPSGFNAKVLSAARELGAGLGLRIGRALAKPVRPAALRGALLEGVETADLMEALRRAGATAAQGYFMSRPLPHGKLIPWLLERRAPQETRLPFYRTSA